MKRLTPRRRRALCALATASAAVFATSAHALTIDLTYLSSVTSLSYASEVESACNYVAQQYEGLYSNNITVDINVNAGTSGLGGSSTELYGSSYSSIRGALAALNSSSDQTTAAGYLPASDPTGSGSTWWVPSAEYKALGLGSPGGADGTFTFNENEPFTFDPYNRAVSGDYDFIGVAEHEFSEIMGRIGGFGGSIGGHSPSYLPFDLYRFTSAGVRHFGDGANVYFSYDGGNTNLKYYNYANGSGSDPQDWLSNTPDSYNAYSSSGVMNSLSNVDVNVMHVIGYNAEPTTLNWSAGAGTSDFLTGGTWSTSSQSGINPHHGAFLYQDTSGSLAYHLFSSGENFQLSSMSDMGEYLEVSAGTFLAGYSGSGPSGPGYGLLINQDGGLFVNGTGVLDVDSGPLSVGDSSGSDAYAYFYGNSQTNVGYYSGGAAPGLFVGNQAQGYAYQEDSATVSTNLLDIGTAASGDGTYYLEDSATLTVSGNETVGDNGAGSLYQYGGSNSVTGTVYIGNYGNSSGYFDQTGGTLTTGYEQVGVYGYGTFDEDGGTQTISNDLILANHPGSYGNMYVDAGSVQVNGSAYVGGNASSSGGEGYLLVDGGAMNISGNLQIYNTPGTEVALTSGTLAVGTLNTSGNPSLLYWSGGTLHFTGEPLDFIGTFTDPYNANPLGNENLTLNNGMNLIVNSWEWLSDSGDVLTQNAGSTNTCAETYIGSAGTPAQYDLNGGTLTTQYEDFIGYANTYYNIGGAAVFNQTGGTHTVPTLYVGYNEAATYTLSGGTLTTTDIDVSQYGTFHQSGGSFTFSDAFTQTGGVVQLDLGLYLNTASYNMSAGSLTTASINDNGNPSLFNWTGGSVTITNQPVDLSNGTDPDYNGIMFGNSLTLNSGMSLTDTSWWEYLYGTGSSITQNSGSSNTTPYLYIGNTSGSGSADTYTLNGGSLNVAGIEFIGYSGTYSGSPASGAIVQSGGTNSASYVYIGYNGPGTYSLSGTGALSVSSLQAVGSSSALIISGGTDTTASLTVASSGTISMSGGSLKSAGTTNNGTVTQTGGTSTLGPVTGTGNITVGNATTAASMTVSELEQNSVTVDSNGTLNLIGGSASNIIDQLSINGTGQFNITNGHIFIDYAGGTDPISSIAAWIKMGFNGGTWNGSGIMSTIAQANGGSYGIGYADSADSNNPANLSPYTIEIAYTLLGDANLDDKVNGIDFNLMATNFNQSGKSWDQGDFNYDGKVNGNDFVLLADNFNQFASQSDVTAADWTALDNFAAANGISLESVPEPTMGMMVLLPTAGVLARRRKRIAG